MSESQNTPQQIKVVGVGGGGINSVNRMVEKARLNDLESVAINTDVQSLLLSTADVKIEIGRELTRGLGAGADPCLGRKAAEKHAAEIEEVLHGAELVFIIAGEGGGTGTGAAPVVAKIARKLGAYTVGIATKPFHFERPRRTKQANAGVEVLRREVDALVVIPNDILQQTADEDATAAEVFKQADDAVAAGIRAITDIVTTPGLINLDVSDLESVLHGDALIGSGVGKGADAARQAAEEALASPLLDGAIARAKGALLTIEGGPNLGLREITKAANVVYEAAPPEANLIYGTVINDALGDEVRVTIVASGI